MKKIVIIIVVIFIIFLSTSYEGLIRGRTEIEKLYSISLGGIDVKPDGEDSYLLSTVAPTTEEEAVKPNNIMTVAGKTAFEANRIMGTQAENDIYWGHVRFVLVGEDAAREDIFKYLDFFMRDHEPRLTSKPFIVRGLSAQELINYLYAQNIDITDTISNIVDNLNLLSYASEMDMIEFINLTAKTQDGYLPYIELETESKNLQIEQGTESVQENEFEEIDEESSLIDSAQKKIGQDAVLHVSGYALIKDGKVVDYIFGKVSRALTLIRNKINSGVIVIEQDDIIFNFEIVQGSSKIKPLINKDSYSADIDIEVDVSLSEVSGQNIMMEDKLVESLKKKIEERVKKQVEELVEKAQELEIDIIGLGDKFSRKYPVKWKEHEKNWESRFPEANISVNVQADILRGYRFKESIYFNGDK